MKFYDYIINDGQGNPVPMSNYQGKVVLIVNTATRCGFTPQYKDLEDLYERYNDKGLEIIDIPCNQFGSQAPGSNDEIKTFCELNFGLKFEPMEKADVNGENALPLYTFLKAQKGFEGFGKGMQALKMKALMFAVDRNYKSNSDIKWNFTKFLVDREGNVVGRFEPTGDIKELESKIKELL